MSVERDGLSSRWTERILMAVGIACLAWYGAVSLHAVVHQRQQRAALERFLEATPRRLNRGSSAPVKAKPGDLIGLLEIPRIRLSAVVVEGDDDRALITSIGHLPDTPLPWQGGNSAFAAHRDTFFRPLRDIQIGDALRISSVNGYLEYRVRQMLVVGPNDVWVLDPTHQAMLTLITCYPFGYIGHAPERFVVHAEQVGRF